MYTNTEVVLLTLTFAMAGATPPLAELLYLQRHLNFLFPGVYGTVVDTKNQWINGTKIKIDQQVHSLSPSKSGEFFFILTQGKHVLEFSAPGELNFTLGKVKSH